MQEVWQLGAALKKTDILRKKGSSMANVFESLASLEQRALGVVAWLTAHGNQLSQIAKQLEEVRADVADIFKQVNDIKQQIDPKKGS